MRRLTRTFEQVVEQFNLWPCQNLQAAKRYAQRELRKSSEPLVLFYHVASQELIGIYYASKHQARYKKWTKNSIIEISLRHQTEQRFINKIEQLLQPKERERSISPLLSDEAAAYFDRYLQENGLVPSLPLPLSKSSSPLHFNKATTPLNYQHVINASTSSSTYVSEEAPSPSLIESLPHLTFNELVPGLSSSHSATTPAPQASPSSLAHSLCPTFFNRGAEQKEPTELNFLQETEGLESANLEEKKQMNYLFLSHLTEEQKGQLELAFCERLRS